MTNYIDKYMEIIKDYNIDAHDTTALNSAIAKENAKSRVQIEEEPQQ